MGFLALVHVIVVLLLVGLTLGTSVSFAVRPGERKLAVMRPLALALLFAVLSATFAGVALTAKRVADNVPAGADLVRAVFSGLAEATVLGIVGFVVLALSWAFVAIGFRRQD